MRETNRTIDPRTGGMGDAVLALWIAEGARRCGDDVRFVAGAHESIINSFGHRVTPEPSDDCMGLGSGSNTFNDEFSSCDVDSTARTQRWQRTVGWSYPATRPSLAAFCADGAEWAKTIHGDHPKVILAPKANVDSRSMPVQKWIRIARALEREGIQTIAIDGYREHVVGFPLYAYGFNWSHLVPLIASSLLVAGNDSGIAHISSTIGVRTVVALGPTNPNIVFGHCLDVVSTVASGEVECTGCHYQCEKGFHHTCNFGCESLDRLPWTKVYESILSSLRQRTLLGEPESRCC